MKRALVFALLCACMATATLHANDTALGQYGANLIPEKNKQISMAREKVDIAFRWDEYDVRADFWFRNTTDTPQHTKVGFPVDFQGTPKENSFLEYRDKFKVEIRGKSVPVAFAKPIAVEIDDEVEQFGTYRQWVCWEMTLAPGEELHTRTSYTFPTSQVADGSAYLVYIVKTGATWKGPIGSAEFTVRYPSTLPADKLANAPARKGLTRKDFKVFPDGFEVDEEKRTITWEFKKLTPDTDIYFGYGKGFGRFADMEKWRDENADLEVRSLSFPTVIELEKPAGKNKR